MQTIVLATQKGGSGKSTLAISLALAAIRAGHTVRLIETDAQGTVSNWKRRRPYADADRRADLRRPRGRTAPAIARRDGVTVTIVDTAAGESAATNSAIRYADFCLIPTRPSIADIEATAATLRVIRAWHKPFAYVLNQTPIRAAARLAGAENALGDEAALDAADIVARPFIVMRNDYQDALSAGLAVCEYAPGGKSAEEIAQPLAVGRSAAGQWGGGFRRAGRRGVRGNARDYSGNGCAATVPVRQRQLPESASPALNLLARNVRAERQAATCPPRLNEREAEAIRTASPAGLLRFATASDAASSPASRAIFPRASDHCDGQARCSRQVRRRSFA